jgi:hypothetical protein
MSTFNVLQANTTCPVCGYMQPFEVQFSFGDVWQHCYSIGDHLKWGANSLGPRAAREVRVDGVGSRCSSCGQAFQDFEILIERDVITDVTPADKRSQPHQEGFRVIRP